MGKISWISLQFAGPNWWKPPFLPWIGLKIRSKWTFQKTGPEKLPLDIGNRGCDGLKPGELTVQFCLWHQTLNFRILWIWRCIFASGINHSISSSFLRASCHLAPNLQVSGVGGGRLRAFLTSGHELAHSWFFALFQLWACLLSIVHLLGEAWLQWQLLLEPAKEFLCGHWNSLGIVQLLDDTQFLCLSWRLVLQHFQSDCAKVKLAGVKW